MRRTETSTATHRTNSKGTEYDDTNNTPMPDQANFSSAHRRASRSQVESMQHELCDACMRGDTRKVRPNLLFLGY